MISNAKKAMIHVAKKQIGMTEDEYRALLSGVGVNSSKDLNNKTFGDVMDRFKALGFKPKKSSRQTDNLPRSKSALMKKLEAIILDMDLDWPYADAIAKSRFKVDRVQWLEPAPLRKLVQMMAIHQKRTLKKQG
ncbi:MAG: regulatory protein GemA [Proteobacteria bacterium]|nr:regulatory protein GemA [Pseudomonadota bacterium]MBU4132814.1 regulatory protein GemA [Pseudomonadota bacterium]